MAAIKMRRKRERYGVLTAAAARGTSGARIPFFPASRCKSKIDRFAAHDTSAVRPAAFLLTYTLFSLRIVGGLHRMPVPDETLSHPLLLLRSRSWRRYVGSAGV